MKPSILLLIIFIIISCSTTDSIDPTETSSLYFPPVDKSTWQTTSTANLGWDEVELQECYEFLVEHQTRAFIVLKDGKIVVEKYWGKDLLGINDFNDQSQWYWASAGKSLTAVLTGIGEQKGLFSIDDSTQSYLGAGWTSMPIDLEKQITIRNQLTMTTGLDYDNGSLDCTDPSCLDFKTNPNEEWFYYNAPYTLIHKVLTLTAKENYNNISNAWVENQIGMDGVWRPLGENNVFFSTARDAARFGLFNLAGGIWDGERILNTDYHHRMIASSQEQNPSYGYLWWLNGKDATVFPGSNNLVPTSVTPAAPIDMYSALGKNGQIIDVVPTQGLVIIRLGSAVDESLVPIKMHNDLWTILNKVFPQQSDR